MLFRQYYLMVAALLSSMAHGQLLTMKVGARDLPSPEDSTTSEPSREKTRSIPSPTKSPDQTLVPPALASPTTSAIHTPALPACGMACLEDKAFYGCAASDFPCICTKERRFIDLFIDKVTPCIAERRGCTEDEIHTFMQAFQETCASLGNPITQLPVEIATWVMSGVWTKYPSNTTAATPEAPGGQSHESMKIGASVGAVVGALLVIGAAVVFCLRRRRRQRLSTTNREGTAVSFNGSDRKEHKLDAGNAVLCELDGDERMEMEALPLQPRISGVFELEGDSGSSPASTLAQSPKLAAKADAVPGIEDGARKLGSGT